MYKLYYHQMCPFCQKVLNYIKENDIKLDLCDVSISEINEELKTLTGSQQVPFLLNEEKGFKMHESDDIIEHLKSTI